MVKRIEAELSVPSASAEEAAAITAALERFERDTAPRQPSDADGQSDEWAHAAILENVAREQDDAPDPWMNPIPG
jgi:hypothetical protein